MADVGDSPLPNVPLTSLGLCLIGFFPASWKLTSPGNAFLINYLQANLSLGPAPKEANLYRL